MDFLVEVFAIGLNRDHLALYKEEAISEIATIFSDYNFLRPQEKDHNVGESENIFMMKIWKIMIFRQRKMKHMNVIM